VSDTTAICVENLAKKYIIGHHQESNQALRNVLAAGLSNLKQSIFYPSSAKHRDKKRQEFWALQDVSFKIKEGERVGIIGRNGAGKSTLLKLISRITEPTEGKITIQGKVASLLEVGTGFHADLTGRENIYLNGAILGMTKVEIERKFDEIVAFAEVEKFLDTPVKRYSSGMYVRLAFAVAAHLEPEILVVDEVLAVGDGEFQKRCLGKMRDVSKEGRTVLFVSHSMGAISTLTDRVLWIDKGNLRMSGETPKVVASYMNDGYADTQVWQAEYHNSKPMQILQAKIHSDSNLLDVRQGFKITVDYVVREVTYGAVISAIIHAADGSPLISTEDTDTNLPLLDKRVPGEYRAVVKIPGDWLSAGQYMLRLFCGVVYHAMFDNIEALRFELTETGNPKVRKHKVSYFLPYLDWHQEKLP